MKKVVLLAFALCFFLTSKSQQDLQFTHFMYDKISFNPAAMGFKDAWCLTAISRRQWTGFSSGEPNTTLINFTTPRFSLLKGSFGLTYFNDEIGFENNSMVRLSYALHLSELGFQGIGGGNFSVGLSAGYYSKVIDATWIPPTGTPDDAIPDASSKDNTLSFNAGVYYRNPNFYAGISTTNLSQSQLTNLNIVQARHYYFMAGYDFHLHDYINVPKLTLRPNVLAKTDAVKTQYDLNINVLAFSTIWAGVTYRHNDALAPMAGLQRKITKNSTVKVGYSYGIGTSFIANYFTNGNHEIMLNYCFKIVPPTYYEREVHPYLL
ncbi:MAG: PorP/SprF family type IX secretion system membrane protein [Flavobacteriales bacterium]